MSSSRRHKRYRKNTGEHGVDDWLMTYADMITLLVCFFAIILSISEPKKSKMDSIRQQVLEKFAQPNVLEGLEVPQKQGGAISQNDLPKDNMPSIVSGFSSTDVPPPQRPMDMSDMRQSMPENDQIKMIEMPSAAFFASGSAVLSDDGKKLLSKIARDELNTYEMRDYIVTVEGHTDDVPINTAQFPSNWELSTARSAAVVRFFIENGISAQRLRAAGYADSQPKLPNRDWSGKAVPENQAQNRRVVMKLEKIIKRNE